MEDLVTSETVIEPFLDVARDQVARDRPFFDTLSKTLDIQADYNIWVQGKLRTNFAYPDVDQQAEGCLSIWNDRKYGNAATRKDLVETLRKNQRRGNCQALIVKLEDSVNNNQKIPKSSVKMKDLNESKNQNPNHDEADCNSEMRGAKTITKIGTQVNDFICQRDLCPNRIINSKRRKLEITEYPFS